MILPISFFNIFEVDDAIPVCRIWDHNNGNYEGRQSIPSDCQRSVKASVMAIRGSFSTCLMSRTTPKKGARIQVHTNLGSQARAPRRRGIALTNMQTKPAKPSQPKNKNQKTTNQDQPNQSKSKPA